MFFSSCYSEASSSLNKFRYNQKSLNQHKLDLYSAVISNDVSTVSRLLALGTSVDYCINSDWRHNMGSYTTTMPSPAWGNLPLIHMVAMISSNDSTAILDAVITAGGNVHGMHDLSGLSSAGYNTSGSILHNTLNRHTNLVVFERLIAAGADVNAKNNIGISVVTALLNTEAYNRCIGPLGYQGEARNEKISLLKLLIKNGATLSETKPKLYTTINETDAAKILKIVASKPITDTDIELLQLCIDRNTTFTPATGGNLLHYIASNLVIDSPTKRTFVEKIINSGIPLNEQDQQGCTPLCIAAQNSHSSVIDILLEQVDEEGKIKVDVNLADSNGATPLHYAAKNSVECLRKLLPHANKDATDQDGATVVHYAANKQTLEILLQHGAKADMPDNNGTTPLMLAIADSKIINASALLRAGANILAKDKDHKTILDFAISDVHAIAYIQAEMTRQQHESVNTQQKLILI